MSCPVEGGHRRRAARDEFHSIAQRNTLWGTRPKNGLVVWFLVDDPNLNRPGPLTPRTGDQPRGAASQAELFKADGKTASRAYMSAVPLFRFLCFVQGTNSGGEFPLDWVRVASRIRSAESTPTWSFAELLPRQAPTAHRIPVVSFKSVGAAILLEKHIKNLRRPSTGTGGGNRRPSFPVFFLKISGAQPT